MPIQKSDNRGSGVVLRSFALGVALLVAGAAWFAINAAPRPKPAAAADADKDKGVDNLQRSLLLDTYRIDGNSGAARGEVIYAYKCWMCHNKYTKGGPYLADVYSRSTLVSGPAVNDENVAAKIKNGGPLMPAFPYILSGSRLPHPIAHLPSPNTLLYSHTPP